MSFPAQGVSRRAWQAQGLPRPVSSRASDDSAQAFTLGTEAVAVVDEAVAVADEADAVANEPGAVADEADAVADEADAVEDEADEEGFRGFEPRNYLSKGNKTKKL